METLARLDDVGKRYVKYEDVPTLLTGVRHMLRRGRRGRLWAVRHVDVEVGRGEALGILGRNGSGKSTTLSMIAGVTAPTEGVVRVRGRIAPLLRLGVGFDQELTGRENVFINGMILGLSQKSIEGQFADIVAFAELEDFIDTPVKFYSSGMLVRLGFASAIAAQPDLLIVDEVLAVGDFAFQSKCFDRMIEMREKGSTLIVVSHNLQAIRRLTERAIVLDSGSVSFNGSTDEAISAYHQVVKTSSDVREAEENEQSSEIVRVLSFDMFGEDGTETANVRAGETVTLRMRLRFEATVESVVFGMSIQTDTGQFVYADNAPEDDARVYRAGDEVIFTVAMPMQLVSGSYMTTAGLRWGTVFKHRFAGPRKAFYVSGRHRVRGIADLNATFDVAKVDDTSGLPGGPVGAESAQPQPVHRSEQR